MGVTTQETLFFKMIPHLVQPWHAYPLEYVYTVSITF